MKSGKRPLLHFILFAIAPILLLLANNIAEARPTDSLRAIFISALLAIIIFVILKKLLDDEGRAAILTTLILVLFFTYGHIYNLLAEIDILNIDLGRHRFLAPLWLGLLFLGALWTIRQTRIDDRLHQTLIVIASISILLSIIQIGSYEVRSAQSPQQVVETDKLDQASQAESDQALPDIYYFVFDEYPRADSLLNDYGFDNQPFIAGLKERGFFIADCSQSNYSWTRLSLASTLNLNYLDNLGVGLDPESRDLSPFLNLITNSFIRNYVEELGYQTVSFPTQFYWTEWKDADYYINPEQDQWEKITTFGLTNSFEALLLETSAGLIITDTLQNLPALQDSDATFSANRLRYEHVMFTLEQLKEVPSIESPKFVYAHVVSPHSPYVIDANGAFIENQKDSQEGFVDQVIYLNSQILLIIDEIIQNSDVPPIILIQSDTGGKTQDRSDSLGSGNRMMNFGAYYFPNGGETDLYHTITPVNSFRILLNYYFGEEFEILDDVSYFSGNQFRFDFIETSIPSETCPQQ